MNTGWHVHQTVSAPSDGERRWDDASPFLLQWAMEHTAGNSPAPSHHQEESHGNLLSPSRGAPMAGNKGWICSPDPGGGSRYPFALWGLVPVWKPGSGRLRPRRW
jgi:hypothetical protein